jgi:predicted Fe-Mo cluster-binding NifX family protein
MRVAIASEGENLNSLVSNKGGRAPYYLIFEDGKLIEVFKNPFVKGGGGAGWSIAYTMAEKKVDLLIAGRIGENMKMALEQKGINYKEMPNKTIHEVLEELRKEINKN